MAIFDLTCPWCEAKQKVPAQGVPFRFYCGNCHDLLTYRGEEDYRACYNAIQEEKRRNPNWKSLDVPVLNRDGNHPDDSRRMPERPYFQDRRKAY